MWEKYSCPACGYGVNTGERYCGNCGVNLGQVRSGFKDHMPTTLNTDDVTLEIMRRVNAYRKLHSATATGSGTAVQNRNSSEANNRIEAAPIRSEIIKLLSSLLNN